MQQGHVFNQLRFGTRFREEPIGPKPASEGTLLIRDRNEGRLSVCGKLIFVDAPIGGFGGRAFSFSTTTWLKIVPRPLLTSIRA